jgi:hypothetical protein
MRILNIVLAACLVFTSVGISMAQNGQADQNMQTTTALRATVQPGPVVAAGYPASADVLINGRLAMRIASSAGGLSPMQRAQIIRDRLNNAFAAGISANELRVGQSGRSVVIMARNMPIATVDAMSACAFGTTSTALAERWATNTRVAMTPSLQAVAGTQQELGMVWSTSPTSTVPLFSQNGTALGNAIVAGPQSALGQVNSVVVLQSTSNGNLVWTFVPITGTSPSGALTRVDNVGLVGIPQSILPSGSMQMGSMVASSVNQMASQWNNNVNSALSSQNLALSANAGTKFVPLYSVDNNQVIGAAQVVGSPASVARTQSVAITGAGNIWQLNASSALNPSIGNLSAQTDVVVSAIVFMPTASMPGIEQGGVGSACPQ